MGGGGDDVLIGDARYISVATGGADRLFGGDGNDTLHGDMLAGGAGLPDNGRGGNDELYCEAGHDLLRGGSGNDILDGGEGLDWAVFDGNLADFAVSGNSVTEIATGETDLLVNVEILGFRDISIWIDNIV